MKKDTVYYTIQTTSNDKPYHIGASRYDSEDSARQALEKILKPGHCGEIVQHTLTVVDTIHCKTPERYPLTFDQAWNLLKYENLFRSTVTKEVFKITSLELQRGTFITGYYDEYGYGETFTLSSNKAEGFVEFQNIQTKQSIRHPLSAFSTSQGKLSLAVELDDRGILFGEVLLEVLTPAKID